MFDTVLGLPLHPLVVHATVVVVPTAALTVALAAIWPWFRRWAGLLPLLLSAAAVLLVPVSTSSGEALEQRVGHSALVEAHAHLADQLIYSVLVMALASLGLTWLYLRELRERAPDHPLAVVSERIPGKGRPGSMVLAALTVLAMIGAASTLVQVARVGHSGAKAAWSDVAASAPATTNR